MNFEEKISKIREELKSPLPGEQQQYLMAPEFRGSPVSSSPVRKAAVMICLYRGEKDLQTVFIKRTNYDGHHSAQVSFPGGIFEEKDQDLVETAIRETREEIGIVFNKKDILGSLSPLTIPVSNLDVHPFVGYYRTNPVYTLEKREVDYLILSPLGKLLNPDCILREKWMLHGVESQVPFYKVNGEIIWGATAMILSEFLAIISSSGLYPQSQH
jgi:8-oxo-dGTP pyrophosphatase MutT (NUDIX family)